MKINFFEKINTSFYFFKEIKNIEIGGSYKPKFKDAFMLTDTSNNDRYMIYLTNENIIGFKEEESNKTDYYIDNIVFTLGLLLSNKEKLSFTEIKEIFRTYVTRYQLKEFKYRDLKEFVDRGEL